MEIQGRVTQVLEEQKGEGRNGTWRKNGFVIETQGQYPKNVCIHVWGDKYDQMPITVGEMVNVSFDVESREWQGKWFTDVKAWKVELASAATAPPQPMATQNTTPPPPFDAGSVPPGPEPDKSDNFEDDLPF